MQFVILGNVKKYLNVAINLSIKLV